MLDVVVILVLKGNLPRYSYFYATSIKRELLP